MIFVNNIFFDQKTKQILLDVLNRNCRRHSFKNQV